MTLEIEFLPRRHLTGQTVLGQQPVRARSLLFRIVFLDGRRTSLPAGRGHDRAVPSVRMKTLLLHKRLATVEGAIVPLKTLS